MKSLKELYRIGKGPSSSHTIGPERACKIFLAENPEAESFKAVLYGSLAKTGVGHGTDGVVKSVLKNVEIECDDGSDGLPHPNTMDLFAYNGGRETASMRVYSVGGGAIRIEGRPSGEGKEVYPLESFAEIRRFCEERALRLSDYAFVCEGEALKEYLKEVWQAMKASVEAGLKAQGVLPGGLGVERKARFLYRQKHIDESAETKENRLVCAYAFAVSEQNASAGTIVTAPTCGASGVLPAVLKYAQERRGYSDDSIVRALAAGGIVGNLIKTNASISGAECGCQAEIGSACCMAAAALGELYEMELGQIEYAAEIAMEHQLGLTCDPIGGLVQIPCIERNAVAAMRAINAVSLADFLSDSRKISFDLVVETMYETGKDISCRYRETAEGGLAKLYGKEGKKAP
ncbi:MAG: L-serine ammonia-lyase, iron-sulfur-dependent, subunit alpha [Christensenellaceae bacterium]|nr:MAG: serine dehydratase [Clostridiales bacterium]